MCVFVLDRVGSLGMCRVDWFGLGLACVMVMWVEGGE